MSLSPSAPAGEGNAIPLTGEHDPLALRQAFGAFATGVAVITTRAADGAPVGITVNSLSSLSLSPALLLWSLARTSRSHGAFLAASHFAVHVLAAGQQPLCRQFSGPPEQRFAGVALDHGDEGVPLLREFLARFECRTSFHHDGGDHSIIVGQIQRFEATQDAPLLFFRGTTAFLHPTG